MATPLLETSAAVEAGRKAASLGDRFQTLAFHPEGAPEPHISEAIPIFLNQSGEVEVADDVLATMRGLASGPRRRQSHPCFHDLASFVAYLHRHRHLTDTVAFANLSEFSVEAIFDYHPAGPEHDVARWMEHRASYVCPRSPEWIAWTERDGKAQPQEAFADFIEARLEDITSHEAKGFPKPMEVLEMARNLMVRTAGTFQRVIDPTTGTGTLVCKTEHGAESTRIPRAFLLGLRVFEGGQPYAVEARLRFELRDGRALFAYTLHRRAEIERDAFGDVQKAIAEVVPVFAGTP